MDPSRGDRGGGGGDDGDGVACAGDRGTGALAPYRVRAPLHVLVVEDNRLQRVALARALVRAGHAVEFCGRAEQALDALDIAEFDVVVTDVRLPAMDGIHLIRAAHLTHPRVPFVVMTAFGTDRDALRAAQAGAYEYLSKPFDVDLLLIVLERVAAVRLLIEENDALRASLAARPGGENTPGCTAPGGSSSDHER